MCTNGKVGTYLKLKFDTIFKDLTTDFIKLLRDGDTSNTFNQRYEDKIDIVPNFPLLSTWWNADTPLPKEGFDFRLLQQQIQLDIDIVVSITVLIAISSVCMHIDTVPTGCCFMASYCFWWCAYIWWWCWWCYR